jgi:hypothetical protein
LRKSFSGGSFIIAEATEDMRVVRIFGGQSGKKGSFFGLITAKTSESAENMYYLAKYGNTAEEYVNVIIKEGTQFAIGGVENGSGMQIYIPVRLQNGKVEYSNIIRKLQ